MYKWLFQRPKHRIILLSSVLLLIFFSIQTLRGLKPLPDNLSFSHATARKVQIVDRQYQALTITYQNRWNLHDYLPLHEIPQSLQHIFILAEDKRFYQHFGVDWLARFNALLQNIRAGKVVRGASTITEQSVRMLHPRRRTFWSRWMETIEAMQLEARFSKAEILEFYLNQINYAQNRRGVVQAARHYFDRDPDTLSLKEMLTLAILVRSPSRLDLRKGTDELQRPLKALAKRLLGGNYITAAEHTHIMHETMPLKARSQPVQARHFTQHIYQQYPDSPQQKHGRLHTTLDSALQQKTQKMLNKRLSLLQAHHVNNGAILIVNHATAQILAWVNAGDFNAAIAGSQIDAVTTPRQPGSTLKPFLYALALEKGWTAAHLINDAPLTEAVGLGLHSYRNYSHHFYGALRLRDALGNSLNTPAIRTIQFVSPRAFLQHLQDLNMHSLTARAQFYGDGLALGNGEITLFELVQAYSVLANQGQFRPLQVLMNPPITAPTKTIYSPQISSLMANILSDSDARRLEFGSSDLLRFPVQTAVKTGTSNDYHDAWAIGFNHQYCVGIWLGNLDQTPMLNVSGASGPALLLRSVFATLNRRGDTKPLYLSPQLKQVAICRDTGLLADEKCASRLEWFVAGTEPTDKPPLATKKPLSILHLRHPTPNLQLALDPRIPDALERFVFQLDTRLEVEKVEWRVDKQLIATTGRNIYQYDWALSRGKHHIQVRYWLNNQPAKNTAVVPFEVH